jgi:GDP-L-fucose synthase
LKKIFIAGHRGLVGSALFRLFSAQEGWQVLTRTRSELDLLNTSAVRHFFNQEKPDYVIDAAAKVGGIKANYDFPVEFLLENLQIQNNLIEASYQAAVSKFLFLGSSCIYPKHAPQPIPESSLLTGPLEPTNDAYALAKIAGVKLCQAYARQYGCRNICAMPTNMYGPHDNYDLQTSHVLPGMINKFHQARLRNAPTVTLWGTGAPLREFLHSDDFARACFFLIENYESPEIINVGTGQEVSIAELAGIVRMVTEYKGEIIWDSSHPDGTPRKLLDSSKILSLGWQPSIPLREGIRSAYQWFLQNQNQVRGVS